MLTLPLFSKEQEGKIEGKKSHQGSEGRKRQNKESGCV